jgi:DNA processing protein
MPSVAIIGSRVTTPYGRQVARDWAARLAGEGLAIISGLALGIDAEAHQGALDAGGRTVAVLGCGIDRNYPSGNKELAQRIESEEGGGVIVSEYEPGVEPAPWRFPARNRIVAGLADVVLIIECRERSGTLITAEFALEMDRPVLAIPRDIAEGTMGSNLFIREKRAAMVLSVADVIGWMDRLEP